MQAGAGRTPLIIAGLAALLTWAAFGEQTPFGFIHKFSKSHHEHSVSITVDTDEKADAGAPDGLRTVAPFDGVILEDGAEAQISVGGEQSLRVSAPGGMTRGVKTVVEDGKLIVRGMGPAARLDIIVPHLRVLKASGAGKVTLNGLHEPIAISANGAVQLTANGAVDSADVTLNGASKLQLRNLAARNVSIHLNGVGDAEVNASESLNAYVNGPGRVRYRGEAHAVSKINGPGSVEHMTGTDAG